MICRTIRNAALPALILLLTQGAGAEESEVSFDLAGLAAPPLPACPPARPPEGGQALVRQNVALVGPANTVADAERGALVAGFVFPPILGKRPLLDDRAIGGDRTWLALRTAAARGRAAGLAGVLYDNRDRGHSRFQAGRWPQLSVTRYGPRAQKAGLDYGLNPGLLFNAPVFGNSSTAITGPFWRSQPRLALTSPGGAARLWQLYAANHLYVFPEHRDHDPAAEDGRGDVFPANTPYYLVSQGSSGSDQPFLTAVAAILAAMPPDVRRVAEANGLVAPTVQMVFRRGLKGVASDDAYMGPRAHPAVFQAGDIDLAAMIRTAGALKADALPGVPCLAVESETRPVPRSGLFGDGLSERLFDTPSAIARVWHGLEARRQMIVDAGATRDPNGRALTFHWRLLRGDPERVAIEPLDEAGTRARITVGWHGARPVPGRPELTSRRVDIVVFADNGAALSAPAFVSFGFPAEDRRHESGPDGALRLAAAGPDPDGGYADPLLFPAKAWRDVFAYDAAGRPAGWTRTWPDGTEQAFTRAGHLVLTRDDRGRPDRVAEVAYPIARSPGGVTVTPAETGRRFTHVYAGPDSLRGTPVPDILPGE